ncbi:hypothetical protein AB0L86_23080 [Micromonospora musae]|uniref:hypothetical protein n=1 Tax=Micromonospora musae TaxID=1894970 RepID=UPI00342FB13B
MLAAIADPGERARRASELIEAHQRAIAAGSDIRRAVIEEMDRDGVAEAEIARRIGVTRQRIGQLLAHVDKIK